MRLHEAYFGNLSREPVELDPGSDLGQKIIADFGSLEAWERDFRAISLMRGVGWAVLAWDREGRSLSIFG
jgi:Fe-Mn family superoxide dismutase